MSKVPNGVRPTRRCLADLVMDDDIALLRPFGAENGIATVIETISADEVNLAYGRVVNSDVRYRFVIDTATIPAQD